MFNRTPSHTARYCFFPFGQQLQDWKTEPYVAPPTVSPPPKCVPPPQDCVAAPTLCTPHPGVPLNGGVWHLSPPPHCVVAPPAVWQPPPGSAAPHCVVPLPSCAFSAGWYPPSGFVPHLDCIAALWLSLWCLRGSFP